MTVEVHYDGRAVTVAEGVIFIADIRDTCPGCKFYSRHTEDCEVMGMASKKIEIIKNLKKGLSPARRRR